MFDHRLLTSELAKVGCTKFARLTYRLPEFHPELKWQVAFRLLGVYRWELDGAVKCSHATATPFAWHCMRDLAGEWWKRSLRSLPALGSGPGCPVAMLAPWSAMHSLNIKELSAQESAKRVANDVEEFVLPFVATIRSDDEYLELLLSDEAPMRWHFSQSLARFAEAAWFCVKLGLSEQVAYTALHRQRALMQGQLFDLHLDQYAEQVFKAAPAFA